MVDAAVYTLFGPKLAAFVVSAMIAVRLLACADANCSAPPLASVGASGPRGFGRDASVAFAPAASPAEPPAMLVSLLDLGGKDEPQFMTARLAAFRFNRSAPTALTRL